MGEQEVKMLRQIVSEMSNKSENTNATVGKLIEQFQAIGQYLGHLEQGVFAISRELNIVKKTNEMVLNMFIQAGVYSQEEIDEKFQEEVVAPIMAMEEERKQRMQAVVEAAKQQQLSVAAPPPVEEIINEIVEDIDGECNSEVEPVLASEKSNVIYFGRKKEEDQ